MRKLYLVNETGKTYFLDYRNETLIESLDGLGFEFESEHQKYDNTYSVVKKTIPLQEISMNLVFLRGYLGYREWVEYIASSKELRLFYTSDVNKYCYINVKSSTKNQLEANTIKSSISIERLSLWIIKRTTEIKVEEDDKSKKYTYRYPYEYSISFNGRKSVTNQSNFAAPMKITISGAINNPRLSIEKDGVAISKLQILLSDNNCRLEINSEPTNQYMMMYKNGEETNIYPYQNFEYDNFLFLPSGTYDLYFEPGVSSNTKCSITFYEGYIGN